MQAGEPDTGMRREDTLPSVDTTMQFLALCERYGSEESAVAAVVPAWNAVEMRAAVDYLMQAGGAAATESGALSR